MKKILFVLPLALFCIAGCGVQTPAVDLYNTTSEPPKPQPKIINFLSTSTTSTPMDNEKPKAVTYVATLHTTEGDIEITLNNNQTPKTVENFVTLSKKNFYDNTIFHRVIKGFMIQGGDPEGTGRGNPGYKFDDEQFTGEYTRGTVAMANSGPNTNGSQFFILHQDYPFPRPDYVIFGHVTKGIEVVDKIAAAPVELNGREISKPVTPVKIKSITVEEK